MKYTKFKLIFCTLLFLPGVVFAGGCDDISEEIDSLSAEYWELNQELLELTPTYYTDLEEMNESFVGRGIVKSFTDMQRNALYDTYANTYNKKLAEQNVVAGKHDRLLPEQATCLEEEAEEEYQEAFEEQKKAQIALDKEIARQIKEEKKEKELEEKLEKELDKLNEEKAAQEEQIQQEQKEALRLETVRQAAIIKKQKEELRQAELAKQETVIIEMDTEEASTTQAQGPKEEKQLATSSVVESEPSRTVRIYTKLKDSIKSWFKGWF